MGSLFAGGTGRAKSKGLLAVRLGVEGEGEGEGGGVKVRVVG